jgi:hypothetical protein
MDEMQRSPPEGIVDQYKSTRAVARRDQDGELTARHSPQIIVRADREVAHAKPQENINRRPRSYGFSFCR